MSSSLVWFESEMIPKSLISWMLLYRLVALFEKVEPRQKQIIRGGSFTWILVPVCAFCSAVRTLYHTILHQDFSETLHAFPDTVD